MIDTRKIVAAACIVSLLASVSAAASLQWYGDVNNNWDGGTVGTDTNWSDGTTPPGDQLIPSTTSGSPDDLLLGTQDINADTLSIGSNVFYVRSLTIGNPAAPPDFGTTTKYLANYSTGGKIVMQASGSIDPTITANMLDTDNGTTATRDVRINAPIELQADTTIERTGYVGSGYVRRLQLGGVISGTGNLTLKSNASGGSYRGSIIVYGNNTFTGDVTVIGGSHIQPYHANAFGNSANQITITADANTNFEFPGLPDGAVVAQNVAMATTNNRRLGMGMRWNDATPVSRDNTWSGDFTGGQAGASSMAVWARDWRRLFFTGSDSTFFGRVGLYHGSEVIVGGANASNVAWENVEEIELNNSVSTTVGDEKTTAFLLRGSYRFDGRLEARNVSSSVYQIVSTIGQMNDGSTAYDATFTGVLDVQEVDYQAVNLYSETDGSATFQGNIYGTGGQGFSVNRSFDDIEGVTRTYGSPTGTVVIDTTSAVALTNGGTGSIGPVTVHNGMLRVDTANFYADSLTVQSGATLGGTGLVTAPVTIDGFLSPGASPGVLDIDGPLALADGSTFVVELDGTSPGDGAGFYDQVNMIDTAGSVSLSGIVTLDVAVTAGFFPHQSDVFYILTRADGAGFSTFFDGLGEGATVDLGGGYVGTITYQADWLGTPGTSFLTGGNDVAIFNVVPEPSTLAMLLGLGGLGLLGYLRRRR